MLTYRNCIQAAEEGLKRLAGDDIHKDEVFETAILIHRYASMALGMSQKPFLTKRVDEAYRLIDQAEQIISHIWATTVEP